MISATEFTSKRSQQLMPLIEKAMVLGKEAIISQSHNSLDLVEAFSIAAASLLVASIPPSEVAAIRKESEELYAQMMDLFSKERLGEHAMMAAQNMAMMQMCAFMAGTSAYNLYILEEAQNAGADPIKE